MPTPSGIGDLYRYRATYISAYDADTIRFNIDLGFGVWLHNQAVRLYGIDAPEMRGDEREQGIVARDFVRGLLRSHPEVMLRTYKDKRGKYGRWLATVFVVYNGAGGVDLNRLLVTEGLARDY